jgi:hypothetical protein
MDLAGMIAESAASQYKKECHDKKCLLTISMHGRYKRDIEIVPMTNHVVLTYNTLSFKLDRHREKEYLETIEFLIQEIEDSISTELNEDIEYNSYWPDHDEFFHEHFIVVKRYEKTSLCKACKQESIRMHAINYLKNLRFIT